MAAPSTVSRRPLPADGEAARVVIIPVHYFGYIPILLWAWVAVWVMGEVFLVRELIRTLTQPTVQSPALLGVIVAVFSLGGGFMAWRAFWVSRGREILELTPDRLVVRRVPGGGHPESYNRSRMHRLRIGTYDRKTIYPSWGRLFLGKESCFLAFDYDGRTQEFARGVSRGDAERIAGLLLNN